MDAVGDAGGDVGEGLPIVEGAVVGDLVAVAARGGRFSWVRVGWADRWWGKGGTYMVAGAEELMP